MTFTTASVKTHEKLYLLDILILCGFQFIINHLRNNMLDMLLAGFGPGRYRFWRGNAAGCPQVNNV